MSVMNCFSKKCRYAKVKQDETLKGTSLEHVCFPYCELGNNISYPFIDDGKSDMRCNKYEQKEEKYGKMGPF